MKIPDKPELPHYQCQTNEYWYDERAGWQCQKCNPETHEHKMETEKKVLIERCKKGMAIFNQGLENIRKLVPDDTDPEKVAKNKKWSEAMEQWKEGVTKLNSLITMLNVGHNFYDCLFKDSMTFDAKPADHYCNDRFRQTNHLCWAYPKKWEEAMFNNQPKPEMKPLPVKDLFSTSKAKIAVESKPQPPPYTDEELR